MKKTIILLFITTVIASGCKKFLDVNTNPNQPTTVTPNVVLSAALVGSAGNIATDYLSVNRYMGYWARSGNYVSDAVNEQYQFTNSQTDNEWANMFATIHRYNYLEGVGLTQGLPFYVGVAKTMEALHFSTLVDVYGNIPYSQTFDPNKYQQPKYDDAATIYTALITKLDSAVTFFQNAKTYYSGASSIIVSTDDTYDIMFGRGNGVAPSDRMDKWIAFANTIKLKLLLHEYKVVTSAYVNTEIAKITANGGGFLPAGTSASVNPGNPGYTNSSGKQNPFYAIFISPTGSALDPANFNRANTYAINFYNSTGDERQNFFYGAPYTSGLPTGNIDGDPQSATNSTISQISGNGDASAYGGTDIANAGTIKSPTQDQLILSDFESLFIQAEAAQRGWITGEAGTFYQQAVEQNFVYLNATILVDLVGPPSFNTAKDDADVYLSGAAGGGILTGVADDTYVVYATSPDPIGTILTQKWAALNSINWVEAWTDYRRTGYPKKPILDISAATTHVKAEIPLRYLYPQSELNTNGANVPSLPAPAQFDPIFWDK